ncbi:MAG: HAD family hydrolase [Candidatus Marsarchaeota archaeon]|nr:HAD family hydrolase [Candidatus Marsarchaeota archaeon]
MGQLSPYKTFIFDWDGTLRGVSTARKLNAALNPHWRTKKSLSRGSVRKYTKDEIAANMRHVHTGRTLAELHEAETALLTFIGDLSLAFIVPRLSYGSRETLEALKEKGKEVALFTDAALWRVYRELDRLNVIGYFDAILSAQSIMRLKPDPLGIEILLRVLRANRRTTIYVGDSIDDIKLAENAGIASAAVTNGFDSASMLSKWRPDYMFTSMEEFGRALL